MGVDEIIFKDAISGNDLDREGCVEIVRVGENPIYVNMGTYIDVRDNGRELFGEKCRVYFVQVGEVRGVWGVRNRVWMGDYFKNGGRKEN